MSKVNAMIGNFATALRASYGLVQEAETLYRIEAFSDAVEVARECDCQYCKAVVHSIYDALADHGDLA